MAELHHLPGAADARPDPEPLPAVPVQGWDCETMNDPAYCAVIVNPAAPDSALADWARAHVDQCCALMQGLTMAPGANSSRGNAIDALYHFQRQASCVLHELSERLQRREVDEATRESDHG